MLPILVAAALAALAASLALILSGGASPAAAAHIAFAAGILPLIFGAMMHFIPVLTRSRAAPAALAWVPALALAGGVWVWAALTFPDTIPTRVAGAVPAGELELVLGEAHEAIALALPALLAASRESAPKA